jgi:hypothetical protein
VIVEDTSRDNPSQITGMGLWYLSGRPFDTPLINMVRKMKFQRKGLPERSMLPDVTESISKDENDEKNDSIPCSNLLVPGDLHPEPKHGGGDHQGGKIRGICV